MDITLQGNSSTVITISPQFVISSHDITLRTFLLFRIHIRSICIVSLIWILNCDYNIKIYYRSHMIVSYYSTGIIFYFQSHPTPPLSSIRSPHLILYNHYRFFSTDIPSLTPHLSLFKYRQIPVQVLIFSHLLTS